MDYRALIQELTALNTIDTSTTSKIANLLNDLTHVDTVTLLRNIKDLETIVNNINALHPAVIPPDPFSQKNRFIQRLERLSQSEGRTIPLKLPPNTPSNEPYFNPLDIIRCDFGGVGWEYDEPHFAVVWEDDHTDNQLTVIPTTSQYTREYAHEFNVGRLPRLPAADTIICVKKMMRISRKRVVNYRGRYKQSSLPNRLKYRIQYAIAIAFQFEIPLEQYVRYESGVALPDKLLTDYRTIRFMPVQDVKYDAKAKILLYRKWDEKISNTLLMKQPNRTITEGYKRFILSNIFSNDPSKEATGNADFASIY